MATSTFYPAAGANAPCDGIVQNSNANFTTCRNAASGNSANVVLQDAVIPQCSFSGGTYYIGRSKVGFDTSSIPDSDTIQSATLSIWFTPTAVNDADNYTLHIVSATPASDSTLVNDDFDQFGSTSFGSVDYSVTTGAYTNITLNAAGLAYINKGGNTNLGLRLSGDLDSVAPTGLNQTSAYHADQAGTGNDPKLTITHAPVTFVPKVMII